MSQLRDSQKRILTYHGGKMGISAVPGSGKTFTLSFLAAKIIQSGELDPGQEVLVVTLVNSAVDNFYQRVGEFVRKYDLIPNLGYRVRTLHGLAHDIVRERPSLVGLDENFQIVDEREADSIRSDVARAWLRNHPQSLEPYLNPDLPEYKQNQVLNKDLPALVEAIALDLIRYAKDQQLTPDQLRQRLDHLPVPLPLAEMGWEMYADYQRALAYRGAVDFDDLIRLALLALELDSNYLERLQRRWPYILEDEAQDSSRLQEAILRKLAGQQGNWVRVGDPNQAIYETFTTANPRYLREFIARSDVHPETLPESGRSTASIIDLANYLVHWTNNLHPVAEIRDALQSDPEIKLTSSDDPQPNPADDPTAIRFVRQKFAPQNEVKAVADSLERYLPENPQATVAVLVPSNKRGADLVDELNLRHIDYEDGLLKSSSATRFSAGRLNDILSYLADPQTARKLAKVYEIWRRAEWQDRKARPQVQQVAELIRKLRHVEDYLWPGPARNWLEELAAAGLAAELLELLDQFRSLVQRWQAAIVLPVDQIVLTIAQDLLNEPGELAVSHKLALLLQNAAQSNPTWRLPELTGELDLIARNERRFLGFSQEDAGFNPANYPGKVVVGTLHKAKGLEWDRVYLMSINNYDFPSAQPGEYTLSDKWFLRDRLNLEAEALAQLQVALSRDEYKWYEAGDATEQARLDYARERLRLLYVGITRAKKELIVTWNTGHDGKKFPALPFVALQEYWEKRLAEV
jgi:DNA helicase II / ATP-dependent DNA helicase PcrA